MHLIDLSPAALAAWPGFDDTVEKLKAEAELGLMSGRGSYDVEAYQKLYMLGRIRCVAVIDDDGLCGWGLLNTVQLPRRDGWFVACDVMWADGPGAGGRILKEFLSHARSLRSPLVVTASVGGRLDRLMSKRAQPTHRVFTVS